MKTQFGQLVAGDFQEKIMVIEIEGDMELEAGKVAVVPVEEYNRIRVLSNEYLSLEKEINKMAGESDDATELGHIVSEHFGLD